MEASKITKHRVSISGILKYLGFSRSGYRAFTRHKPSATQQRKNALKQKILKIYDKSKQNYEAPKITAELRKDSEKISERTVDKYMRGMGIRANGSTPGSLPLRILTSPRNCTAYWTSTSIRSFEGFALSHQHFGTIPL